MFHRVNSAHNKVVKQQIINKVNSQEYSDKIAIACKSHYGYFIIHVSFADAAKKYHEYLVRLQKPIPEQATLALDKSRRNTQRRQRVGLLSIKDLTLMILFTAVQKKNETCHRKRN